MKDTSRASELLTAEEAANFLRVSLGTVRRYCRNGAIPATKVGQNWLIPMSKLRDVFDVVESSASERTTDDEGR